MLSMNLQFLQNFTKSFISISLHTHKMWPGVVHHVSGPRSSFARATEDVEHRIQAVTVNLGMSSYDAVSDAFWLTTRCEPGDGSKDGLAFQNLLGS